MNDRIIATSHAKINWWLKVGPPRPDGYHDLETVFQELDLGETISFHKNESDTLNLSGFPPDISPEGNLVTRSWNVMRQAYPGKVGGVDVEIAKTLPRGGGLGGGSSNAACTLAALNSLFELGAGVSTLEKHGARIGADVAFFIRGGTAIGTGRGEILEQQPPVPRYWLVLVVPGEPMPTAQAYRELDKIEKPAGDKSHTLPAFLTNLYSGNPTFLANSIHNDFELVASKHQWFTHSRDQLLAAGALRAFLCGSGSTVAGIVTDELSGQRIAETVKGILTSTRYTP
jgi:4-diphosphocytidyl-2-C-methyl-D-erythritol kinase